MWEGWGRRTSWSILRSRDALSLLLMHVLSSAAACAASQRCAQRCRCSPAGVETASPRTCALERSRRAGAQHQHLILSRHKGSDVMTAQLGAHAKPFRLEEATIEELQAAITSGQTTCVAIVQHYINRVRAYNGVASALVTQDGAPVSEAPGAVRAQVPLRFPTATVKASAVLPDLDKYTGPPLEYGRMEATASDPAVQQQFGMIVGLPHAGQVNALATLNIRGERSVTCRGDFDRQVSAGPLPPGAPPVCEEFRRFPGARSHAGRTAPEQGGDHLRQGRQHGIQRPGRRSGWPPRTRQSAAVDAGLSAQHLGRQSRQPLRHDTRGLAR